MKNIRTIQHDRYNHPPYESAGNGIYKNTEEDIHVFAINYDLEEQEDSQYPLEDLLDKFYLHVSHFFDEAAFSTARNVSIELGGELEDVQQAMQSVIGKRVYNSEYKGDDGKTYVKLIIE